MAPRFQASVCLMFAILLVFFDIVGTLATPSWNNDSIEVRQGTNVEMACTVPLTSELDTVRIFKWNKHKQCTISDNDQPKTPFIETGRYSTFYEYNSGSLVGVIRLQLTGARVGDSGRIGCRILGDDDVQNIGYVQLKVFAPVLEVSIKQVAPHGRRKWQLRDTVELVVNKKQGVLCRAVAQTRDMNMRITIDGVDRTDMFSPTVKEEMIGCRGLATIRKEMTLVYLTKKPPHEFNKKNMTCSVTTDGDKTESASTILLVQYAPIVTRSQPDMYVTLGERATITWDVRMKELDYENDRDVDYQLQWLSGETKTPLDNYRLDSNYRIDEKILSEEHAVFHLVIQEVTRADVTTFYVVAENSFGTTESSVRLRDISEQRHAYVHVANSCATEAPRWTSLPVLLVVTSVVLLCNTLRIN